ncbi:ATP-dependent helicase/nuclease subunit A [Planctomycetes bacterium Pla163]|uniref:DNA 3'-5' helicase n=1 Tax=Rohdeia mirabilis TaxID=2528008 RepID=A0A518CYH4_9BACT|nr:ATP-dependent helicase/nuclease subunit A [Planctomycetes bacterium Pla163]
MSVPGDGVGRDLAALRENDAMAREAAVTVFDAPLAIEAGAGTGKTTTLVGRIVTWCLAPGWERARAELSDADDDELARRVARGVFAITFTEAAAAEMAERAATVFAQVAAGAIENVIGLGPAARALRGDAARRATALLAAVDLLEIGTIHAFCGRILRDQALALGLHPAFRVDADGNGTRRVARRVVAELWPERLEAGDADALLLAQLGTTARDLVQGLVDLTAGGALASDLERDPDAPVAAMLTALDASAAALLGPIAGAEWDKRQKKPDELRAALVAWCEETAFERTNVERSERARELFEPVLATAKDWAKSPDKVNKGVAKVCDADELHALARPFAQACAALGTYDPVRFAAAQRVAHPLASELGLRRRREGWLGFDDLLALAARWALKGGGGVDSWRRRIDQLLVDEFQDTDARQCDLVRGLALAGAVEERPGLFVVGDPKQSIYGWRGADLGSYEGLVTDLVAAGGTKHSLSVNYRSNQAVLDEVGRVLVPHLVHEPGVQAQYEPLVVPKGHEPREPIPGQARVEHWLCWPLAEDGTFEQKPKSARVSATEARCVAADLVAARAADPELRWRDVGLLMRSSTDQELLLRALREAGIPFAVARERSFWHHREVRDAGNLYRAVLDPTDALALAGWLIGPHVGTPDGALAVLWSGDEESAAAGGGLAALMAEVDGPGHPSLAAARALLARTAASLAGEPALAAAPTGWATLVDEQLERLAHLRASWRRDGVERFVDAVRRSNAAEAGEAARRLGRFRTANLDAFHAEFEQRARTNGGDEVELLRLLRAPREDRPDAQPRQAGDDAVQILSIHAAKGLEFRLVYLLHGHKNPGGSFGGRGRTSGTARAADGTLEVELFGQKSAGYGAAEQHAADVSDAERARLLYVALTRAAERLVVCATPAPDKLGAPTGAPQSFSDYVAHRRPPGLGERLDAERAGFVDDDGVRWRVPSAALPDVAGTARVASEPFVVDLSRADGDRAAIAAARERAAARGRRPVAQAASDGLPEDGFARGEFAARGDRPDTESPHAGESDDAAHTGASGVSNATPPAAAAAVGTLVHELLARRVDGAELDNAAWDAARAQLTRVGLDAREQEAGALRLAELRAALESGPLLTRLDALIADDDVSGPFAEVPVLLAANDDDETAPTSHYSGAADLVLADATGWAIVDFKTDALASAEERDTRAAHYAPQLARYAAAIQQGLGLDNPPRRELWWLATGEVSKLP